MIKRSILAFLVITFCFQQNTARAQQDSKYKNIKYNHDQEDLYLSMDLYLQDYYINSGDSLTLTPIIKAGDKTTALPNVIMMGGNQLFFSSDDKDALKQDKNNLTHIIYKTNIPFESWMANAELILSTKLNQTNGVQLYNYTEKLKGSPAQKSNNFTELLPNTTSSVINENLDNDNSIKSITFSLKYPYKKAMTVASTKELKELNDIMSNITDNENATLIRIDINAITSIDGTYADNEKLTLEQATAFKSYLQQIYDIPESYFEVKGSSEDWDGLAKLVEDSNMAYKQEVLDIMSKYGIFNGREKELMLLKGGQPYIYMKNNMFPESQKLECKIVFSIRK